MLASTRRRRRLAEHIGVGVLAVLALACAASGVRADLETFTITDLALRLPKLEIGGPYTFGGFRAHANVGTFTRVTIDSYEDDNGDGDFDDPGEHKMHLEAPPPGTTHISMASVSGSVGPDERVRIDVSVTQQIGSAPPAEVYSRTFSNY